MPVNFLKGKTMLVTGGTGSFGKNFVKHLLKNFQVKKVIVFSRDELKQFHMRQEISDSRIRFFLGDIRDSSRLERAFRGVDVVVHAAALKQVPTLEYNPFEAVKTNILGSQNVIEMAIDNGVSKTVLISTDKAAQPVNLYGSTKLCAEKLFINGNSYVSQKKGKFSCVRYGNVVGSRGSIIEHLAKNKNPEKVFITHSDMTRFWITYEQAFKLVLFALENMEGGEVFVPKIPSMKLTDMFDAMAPKSKKEIIGIRPGEKLHEVLLTREEARHGVELKDYYVILPENEEIFSKKRFEIFFKKGKKLSSEFEFKSDSNHKWIDKSRFLEIFEEIKTHIL